MLPSQMGSLSGRLTMSHIVKRTIMSFDHRKSFEIFTCLGPPRFIGVMVNHFNEFFIHYQVFLENHGSLEQHEVAYTTYQQRVKPRDWQRTLVSSRSLGTLEVTWNQFIIDFLDKYISYNLWDHIKDKLDQFEQGFMTVVK